MNKSLSNDTASASVRDRLRLNSSGGLNSGPGGDPDRYLSTDSPNAKSTNEEATFNARAYLHPKYWGSWLGLGLLWLLTRLPFDWVMGVGRIIGSALYWVSPTRRRATATNIGIAFPELNPAEQSKRVKAVYSHVGMTAAETGWIWFRSIGDIEDRFSVSGLDHLDKALSENTGVILLQAHFSALEITGAYVGPRLPIIAVYDSPKNLMIREWLLMQRKRRLAQMVDNKNIRNMIRFLKRGNIVWYSPDQHVGESHGGIQTQYFDQSVLTSNGTVRIARMTNATIIPIIPTRHQNGRSYHIAFFSPVQLDLSNELASTQAINDLFEKQIRHYPEQYLWLHKRFKPPPGVQNPYS